MQAIPSDNLSLLLFPIFSAKLAIPIASFQIAKMVSPMASPQVEASDLVIFKFPQPETQQMFSK